MIRTMFRGVGRIALWLASMAFLTAVGLFVIGSYVLTWPVLRLSPREKRIRAVVDFASSAMTVMTVFSENHARKVLAEALELADRENVLEDEEEDEGSNLSNG